MASGKLSLVFGALADPIRRAILIRRFWGESHARLGELLAALQPEGDDNTAKGNGDE